jgi:hypothetical protein
MFIYTGNKYTGRSCPDPENFFGLQTFATRKRCLFCRFVDLCESHDSLEARSGESPIIKQAFSVLINIAIVNNNHRSFRKSACVFRTQAMRYIILPIFRIDTTKLIWNKKTKCHDESKGHVMGAHIDDVAVFPIPSSWTPNETYLTHCTNPRYRYVTRISNIPKTWDLLLVNLNSYLTTNWTNWQNRNTSLNFMPPTKLEMECMINVFKKGAICQNNQKRNLQIFYTNVLNPPCELDFYAKHRILNFEDFMNRKIEDLFFIHAAKYKYLYWNPFVGTDYKVRMFPCAVLLIIRVNMIINFVSRVQRFMDDCFALDKFVRTKKQKEGCTNDSNKEYPGLSDKHNKYDKANTGNIPISSEFLIKENFINDYYFLKRLKCFLSAHICIMDVIERLIQSSLEIHTHMN